MTVSELIEKLQELNPYATVYVLDDRQRGDACHKILEVYEWDSIAVIEADLENSE